MSRGSSPGSPIFCVVERHTGRRFLAQRKPLDEDLERDIQMHNVLRDSPDLAQLHQVITDDNGKEAVLVYENTTALFSGPTPKMREKRQKHFNVDGRPMLRSLSPIKAADRSFIDALLPPPSATRRSHSRSPQPPAGTTREAQVQVFVKQLLTALQYMHRRGIAHLDLRPEVILLQDDHLRLADFGQSRRLIAGKVQGGTIKSNPEFVSPEVVSGGRISLAADMWSVGALTYVLLVGQSPFLGDNDEETLQNVLNGECRFEGPCVDKLSVEAKEFLRRLLAKDSHQRMDVDQALEHNWLSDPQLGDAKLSTDCLREFKYQQKWLERRVFVQQTPSEQLTQLVDAPKAALCATSESPNGGIGRQPARAEPFAIYDYLHIKEASKPEGAKRAFAHSERDAVGRNVVPEFGQPRHSSSSPFSPNYSPNAERHAPPLPPRRSQSPADAPAPPVPDWIIKQLPPGIRPEDLVWDPRFGGGFYIPPHLQPKQPHSPAGQHSGPPSGRSSRSNSGERQQMGPGPPPGQPQQRQTPPGLAPLPATIAKKIEAMAAAAAKQGDSNRSEQQPKSGGMGEEELLRQLSSAELKLEDLKNPQSALMKLIRGERRQIQDELANRVLSDISEESSIRSTLSGTKHPKKGPEEDAASTTTTAEHEGPPSSSSATPLASPAFSAESPQHQFFGEREASPPEVLDERDQHFSSAHLPLNVSPFREEPLMENGSVLDPPGNLAASRGTKQALLSPTGEHTMQVHIGVGAKRSGTAADSATAEQQPAQRCEEREREDREATPKAEHQPTTANGQHNGHAPTTKYRPLPDAEYDLLMDEIERTKNGLQRKELQYEKYRAEKLREIWDEDLEKYRPSTVYKELELEVDKHKAPPADDFAWESQYQIGPETLLIPSRGAKFNARVRDYRRELWGDSAAQVVSGVLGWRNQDVTVRERRRYTDLLREDPQIAKSVDTISEGLLLTHQGALRRVNNGVASGGNDQDLETTGSAGEKRAAPIFRSRLRDAHFTDGAQSTVLECTAIANPTPQVTFFHHDSAICEDGRHQISQHGNKWKLTILRPLIGVDTGEYSCVAENELGRDKCACKCTCGEPPSRPSRPEVELSADTEVYVSWEAPERLPVTLDGVVYRLECRPAGESDAGAAWTCVSDRVEDEAAVVKHLRPLGIYQFRVCARNAFGWGEPSITSRIIRTHPKGIPKLNLDVLRREGRRFGVVSMPQKQSRKGTGLTEILEELDEKAREADEEEEEAEADGGEEAHRGSEAGDSEHSAETTGSSCASGGGRQKVALNTTEDPLKRFQLESELFRGQFSVIRYAIDSVSGAHCTVKIRAAPSHGALMFATPAERMRAAQFEYETLAECQHENVVQLIAAYASDNAFLLLFTERLYENVFQRFVRLESYTEEQIAFTVRQVADALHWINFRGVAHLDVEPTNVMFTSKRAWRVKLVDFGRARPLASAQGASGDGQLIAEWSAPEVLLGKRASSQNSPMGAPLPANGANGLPSPHTDMWGLGLITFCLLAGFHPFADDDDSEQEVRKNVLEQRCNPNLIPVQASEEALCFVVWALKKEPTRRMRTDEALNHRFLASDAAMVRRRENIRYASHRLLKTAERRLRQQSHFARNGNGNGSAKKPNGGGAEMMPPSQTRPPQKRMVSAEC